MPEFYNPFHWVPVESESEAQRHLNKATQPQVTHERYVRGAHSGRLVVRLTTVTSVAVGAERTEHPGGFPKVQPYKAGDDYAIPGSSLRGAVGSVMEAASNAPLRVLHNRVLSFRRTREKSLSAVGILVAGPNGLQLKPLALPTLPLVVGGDFEAPARFVKIFTQPLFKVYVGTRKEITTDNPRRRTSLSQTNLHTKRVARLAWAGNKIAPHASLHKSKNGQFLVAQNEELTATPVNGLLRVLGCWGEDRKNIPPGKEHELWLPWDPTVPCIPILSIAVERFHDLADERTDVDTKLPFEPRDTNRNDCEAKYGARVRLKENDIVFFDVDKFGNVCELSLSSIWRARVEDPSTQKAVRAPLFFPHTHRPLSPARRQTHVVEDVLGYVEEEVAAGARMLASRVRFFDAMPAQPGDIVSNDWLPLKILASPKPPSPALYFRRASGTGGFAKKADLRQSDHAAQGRKWYLHSRAERDETPWRFPRGVYAAMLAAERASLHKQAVEVKPIMAGRSFHFHIDLDNLSNLELGLLLHALEPNPEFHHKIGMGKPLGLGSVKMEVLGWFPIPRQDRYTVQGLSRPRYAACSLTKAGYEATAAETWPSRYSAEAAARRSTAPIDAISSARSEVNASGILSLAIQRALKLLGDFAHAPLARDVHYPTVEGQGADAASEHFKWFQFNEGGLVVDGRTMGPSRQFLEPITDRTMKLQELVVLEWLNC